MSHRIHEPRFNGNQDARARRGSREPASRLVWAGRILIGTFLILALILGSTATPVQAKRSKKDYRKLDAILKQVADRDKDQDVPVIVRYRDGAADRFATRLAGRGRTARHHFPDQHSIVTDANAKELDEYEDDGDVEGVSLDADISSFAKVTPYTLRSTLGLASSIWTGDGDGHGVGVAIIDSGLEKGNDLEDIKAFYTISRGIVRSARASDEYGHGTHVAGLIGGSGSESSNLNYAYRGVAPGAEIIALRVLDHKGGGRTSDVIAALNFARMNRSRLGIDVINLSLGHPILEPAATDPLVRAVEAAVRDGIVVVCSAGNFGINPTTGQVGYAGITSPGNAPSAITVGALDTMDTLGRGDDQVAPYSSRGPTWLDGFAKPDLVAPGFALTSVAAKQGYLYRTYPQFRIKTSGYSADYFQLSGTSMAAAVATGAVALVLEASQEAFPYGERLTPNAVKAILQFTALPVRRADGVPYDALSQGAGALNVEGALRLARAINPSKGVGRWWLSGGVTPSTTVGGQSIAWSQTVIWGGQIASGDSIYYNLGAWATNVVWGDNIVWGGARSRAASVVEDVVWSENIVWGGLRSVWANSIVWGDNILWGNALDPKDCDGNNIVWGGVRAR